jgi:hypothetical protein
MTPTCGECYWLKEKSRFGRDIRSCQDLGEKPESEICDRFMTKPKDAEKFPEWVQEQIGALANVRYKDLFHEIIAEGFVLEQDSKLAVQAIKIQLQTQGADVVLDGKEFEKSVGRLIDIYQVYRMACVIGLGSFANEIVSAEIQRRFKQYPGTPVTLPVPSGGGRVITP